MECRGTNEKLELSTLIWVEKFVPNIECDAKRELRCNDRKVLRINYKRERNDLYELNEVV